MSTELVNQTTGEVVTLEEHLEAARGVEREIGKLDRALADIKEEAKELKAEREKAVKDLRAMVRDNEPIRPRVVRRRGGVRRKGDKAK